VTDPARQSNGQPYSEYNADAEYPENLLGDYEIVASHYWDANMSEHDDQTVMYSTHSHGSRCIYAAQYVFDDEAPSSSSHSTVHTTAGIIDKTVPPMYDHHLKHKNTMHHKWVRNDDATLSGFFEINGTKAHCLFDSGCEGVMLSPDFTQATGVKTFSLEHPIGLQLACVSSRSTINYGANTTITVGSNTIDQYFDIANVDFYDVILGTPFLWHMGIGLDFTGPGYIQMANEFIPNQAGALPNKEADTRVRAPP
jgi:hypothetical protein